MANRLKMACPHCGMMYALTREYIDQYGGREIQCNGCLGTIILPQFMEEVDAAIETMPVQPAPRCPRATVACPHCGRQYTLTANDIEKHGGREIQCSRCRQRVAIPSSLGDIAIPAQAIDAGEPDRVLPYAPPALQRPAQDLTRYWREDDLLVIEKDAVLPERCLLCNRPSGPAVPVKLRWSEDRSEAAAALARRAVISAIAKEVLGGRRAAVRLPLCRSHRPIGKAASIGILLAEGLGFAGLLLGYGLPMSAGSLARIAILAASGCLILAPVAWLASRSSKKWISAAYTDHRVVKLRGVHPDVLASIPVKQLVTVAAPDHTASMFDQIE